MIPTPSAAKPGRGKGGFTLIELMIALSLMALLMGGIYEVLNVARRSRSRSIETVRLNQVGRAALARIRADLEALIQNGSPLNEGLYSEDGETGRGGFTFSGDFAAFLTASRVARAGALRHDPDDLEVGKTSDMLQIEYYIGADPEEEGQGLIRRVNACLNSTASQEEDVWESILIAEEVLGLDFRWFDGEGWQDEWDTETTEGYPEAVEVTLTLGIVLFEEGEWVPHFPDGRETARKTCSMVVPLRPKPQKQMEEMGDQGGGPR
ncbi:MAG: type II secretion system protein GspJ [Planctomycetota bacterium]|jgi:prepilin-type N-terminal cleavage/methylation domain-containing protein